MNNPQLCPIEHVPLAAGQQVSTRAYNKIITHLAFTQAIMPDLDALTARQAHLDTTTARRTPKPPAGRDMINYEASETAWIYRQTITTWTRQAAQHLNQPTPPPHNQLHLWAQNSEQLTRWKHIHQALDEIGHAATIAIKTLEPKPKPKPTGICQCGNPISLPTPAPTHTTCPNCQTTTPTKQLAQQAQQAHKALTHTWLPASLTIELIKQLTGHQISLNRLRSLARRNKINTQQEHGHATYQAHQIIQTLKLDTPNTTT